VRLDDRVIRATLESNRQLVEANDVKIRDLTSQLSRYTALLKQKMGTQLDVEKSEMALAEAREALAKATLLLRQAEIELEHVEIRSTIDGIVLERDRKSTRLNSSHLVISYAVFCLKKKTNTIRV